MKKHRPKIAWLIGTVSLLFALNGCSIFKEDDCGCPTFGENTTHQEDSGAVHAQKSFEADNQ